MVKSGKNSQTGGRGGGGPPWGKIPQFSRFFFGNVPKVEVDDAGIEAAVAWLLGVWRPGSWRQAIESWFIMVTKMVSRLNQIMMISVLGTLQPRQQSLCIGRGGWYICGGDDGCGRKKLKLKESSNEDRPLVINREMTRFLCWCTLEREIYALLPFKSCVLHIVWLDHGTPGGQFLFGDQNW